MNTNKILYSPLINKAALARHIWPDAKDAKVRLAHKMNGKNGRSLTDKENERILEAIKALCQCEEPEIRCTCGWEGDLQELEIGRDRFGSDYDVCPNCKTSGHFEETER